MQTAIVLRALARTLAAGEQSVESATARCVCMLGREWKWIGPLATRYLAYATGRVRPREREVVHFLEHDRRLRRALATHRREITVREWLLPAQQMRPVTAARPWELPCIESVRELCDWFWLEPGQLEWFADLKGLNSKGGPEKLDHYFYRSLLKPDGGIRLIEAPKRKLKKLQQQILREILDRVPAHPAANGFVRGKSVRTFAAPHVGQRVVLRLDIRHFFPSVRAARIQTVFRTLGYPESVADRLGGLCTNLVPHRFWPRAESAAEVARFEEARNLYSRPHLPQGAATSPAVANICCYRLDCRLAGLAHRAGAAYTRYADDLAFSGDDEFARGIDRFAAHIAAIVRDEGFAIHHRKTRVMRTGVRQHLAGLVVNQRMNIARGEFDRLKATLTNCVRYGPAGQNREAHPDYRAHLEGRVAWVESVNPQRGARLRGLLTDIQW